MPWLVAGGTEVGVGQFVDINAVPLAESKVVSGAKEEEEASEGTGERRRGEKRREEMGERRQRERE
jgi:hypothetical protein